MFKKTFSLALLIICFSSIKSMDINKEQDFYQRLGLERSATIDEIKTAYRRLAIQHHPDKGGNEDIFKLICEAYATLSDESKKTRYDLGVNDIGFHGEELFCRTSGIDFSNFSRLNQIEQLSRIFEWCETNGENPQKFVTPIESVKFNYFRLLGIDAQTYLQNYYELSEQFNKISMANTQLKAITPSLFAIQDLYHFIVEANRIIALGSQKPDQISKAAELSRFRHILSIILGPVKGIKEFVSHKALDPFDAIDENDNFDLSKNNKIKLARALSLLPNFAALKFVADDNIAIRDAKKIAAYNKVSKRDLSKSKIGQWVWLGINKILPYAVFMRLRAKEGKSLSEIFSIADLAKANGNSIHTLKLLKSLADISEIIRKSNRNKVEKGDYVKFLREYVKSKESVK